MGIAKEIESHHEWKLKLIDYAKKRDGSITVESACFDHQCSLGKLLKELNENGKLEFPEMGDLIKEHRSFHRIIGELVKNINNGVEIIPDMSFGPHSPFTKHVTNIEKLLTKLIKVVV
jgi:RNA processing factor Prp31